MNHLYDTILDQLQASRQPKSVLLGGLILACSTAERLLVGIAGLRGDVTAEPTETAGVHSIVSVVEIFSLFTLRQENAILL